MHLYFDPNVCLYYCPEDFNKNSKLIECNNVETFIPIYQSNPLAFFKCAGIEKNNEKYMQCSFTTDCKNEFTFHVRKNHKYLKLICVYCSDLINFQQVKFLKNPISLVIHLEEAHKNLYFQCNLCSYRAITADHVNIHQATRHISTKLGERFVLFCPKPNFNTEITLKYFYDTCKARFLQSDNKYQCLYCDYLDSNLSALILHLIKIHFDLPLLYYKPFKSNLHENLDSMNITDENDLLTDDEDEDLLTDDDEDDKNIEISSPKYCCFFCNDNYSTFDSIKSHIQKHLFANSNAVRLRYVDKNKFFDNWINWFIYQQHTYIKKDLSSMHTFSRCPICIKLKLMVPYKENNDELISAASMTQQALHYIQHSGFKPFQCLLCKNYNKHEDFWLPDIFQYISQHLMDFHKSHLQTFKSLQSFDLTKRKQWNQLKPILLKESILYEYSMENADLYQSMNVHERNALKLLENTYKKNYETFQSNKIIKHTK